MQQDISRHLVRAQEEERKRISRELHDDTGQALMLLRMHLGSLAVESHSHAEVEQVAQEALTLLDQTIEGLRRTIARLSPKVLEELGLLAAIRRLARDLGRTNINVTLDVPESLGEMQQESEIAIYRAAQEALNNAARHSQAENVWIKMERSEGWLSLILEDDGVGLTRSRTSGEQTFGLMGMKDRIAAVGGTLKFRSPKGKGTEIRASVPITSRKKDGHTKKAAA